ncbi:SOS response-associated peptidase [Sulfitobacter delicatus]|jgi:putative SOS response-associated peptidase YedK|uniref:Abasic site processing protein n=1 Tax=Sulfitobacter delicatus TaxID=218672 RepID=A0A1G7YX09_9RHOB|nr:SOS response-associated peptidase [Sulfitobacter delicatus]SDH00974.1 Putative SOS response-associated peptidase YedK [Sulfitobacter delicatus]
MCNLYANIATAEAMRRLFQVAPGQDRIGNAEPRPAIFPKGLAPVVRLDPDGKREMIEMRWGFLTPQVSKKTGKPIKPAAWNNARDDKLRKSGLWRGSFEDRRCLVPVTSFNETKGRQPATDYWFALTGDDPVGRPLFAFAGLWRAENPELIEDEETELRHTVVTTEANELIRPIHAKGRMPVILEPADYDTWLTGDPDQAATLIRAFPAERMTIVLQGLGEKRDQGASSLASWRATRMDRD